MLPLILSNNKTRLRKDQNLCFVNATLQVLYSIDDVRAIFTADDPSAFPPSWPLSKELSRIFHSAGTQEISASELRRYFSLLLLYARGFIRKSFTKLQNKDKCIEINRLEIFKKKLRLISAKLRLSFSWYS
jgi:hypothetical protein